MVHQKFRKYLLIEEVTENCEYKLIRCDDCNKEAEIMDNYWQELAI